MKYYLYEGDINKEHVEPLIAFLNNNEGEVTIGLNSVGGEMGLSRLVLKMLNDNKERVTLMAVETIESAAFNIFRDFRGKKLLSFGCRGMLHHAYCKVFISGNGKITFKSGRAISSVLKSDWKETHKKSKGWLTKKEVKLLNKDKDVNFDFERMKELFPGVKVV